MQDLPTTLDAALTRIGTGRFQRRLLGIFGLVWAADAMQVLAVGFTAPSLAAQFGPGAPALLGTVFFVGMAIGAPLFGRIADRHGRRNVLIGTVMLDAVFGLVAYGAPQYWLLILARFITGLAVGGTLPVDYAMMAEFLPSAKRGRWLVGLEAFWAVGTLVLSIGAFAAAAYDPANAWRWILLLTAMPALIGFWLRLWIPESPLYLAATGRLREAHQVVDMIAVTNGAPPLGTAIRFEAAPRLPLSALFRAGAGAHHGADAGDLVPGVGVLLRPLHLAAGAARPPGGPRLHPRPGLPDPVGAGAIAGLRARRLWRGALGPAADADGLPDLRRTRLRHLCGGLRPERARRRPARHELRAARRLGRALRLHAGTLPDGAARLGHGRGRRGGPYRRHRGPDRDRRGRRGELDTDHWASSPACWRSRPSRRSRSGARPRARR